ncbi:hypothetical protein GDO86_000583 [Hymenochirus boettgeri]|uniref:Microtubule-associated protein 9 n=1 Tax=Hymenochirus boettgeri TaxID=247094 RepID=A0A8T2KA39_9PIPI|nr:hypothetical protein GDO86_000583 [Hymenochirus boettgeri]
MDDDLSTILAYTKSPKIAKRTTFQDELKKAINARVLRQQAIEEDDVSDYSEEFDSDGSLNDSENEETAVESKVQKLFHDFHFSEEEESELQKTFLKNKSSLQKVEKELDNAFIFGNKNKEHSENGLLKSKHGMKDTLLEEEKETKPTPKPRETRIKSTSSNFHDGKRRSPSVLQMMLENVNEKSIQQEIKVNYQDRNEIDPENVHQLHANGLFAEHSSKQARKIVTDTKGEEPLNTFRSSTSRSLNSLQTNKNMKGKLCKSAKSRYLGTLTVLDKSIKEVGSDIEAADALRATVYQNWLESKKTCIQELHNMKKFEAEKEKEKLKQDITKKEEATAAFQVWKTEKAKEIRKNLLKQKEEELKKMKEIQEIAQKKDDSKKAFEMWKEHKDVYLKEKIFTERNTETEKKNKELKDILEKKKDNMAAVKKWNTQKKYGLKEKQKVVKDLKLMEEQKQSEKFEKEKKALEMYEQWLERKERGERIGKKQKRPPPPWSPPGKTIPARR